MNICTYIRGIPVPPKDNKVMIIKLERYKLLKDNHIDARIDEPPNKLFNKKGIVYNKV